MEARVRRRLIRGIEVGGAVASLAALAFSEDVRNFLGHDLILPRWAYLASITACLVSSLVLGKRRTTLPSLSEASTHLHINQAPKLVTSEDKGSVDALGTAVLKAPRGTFSTWVYLGRTGDGIRRLVNNRYILACTTRPNPPYANVVALCHGPLEKYDPPQDPSWKVWLANQTEGRTWSYPDGREFKPGWHLLVLRWDHGIPQLHLLIDGRVIIDADGYERFWPRKYPDRLLVGCWPSCTVIHYADTHFWRTQLLSECVTEHWVTAELTHVPPAVVT